MAISRLLCLALLLMCAGSSAAQSHIAPTEALSPSDERAKFKLPPGFEAQLVASEPDIGKPIQMAFDARGRLWITTSAEYPFAAEGRPGKDKLYVLEDFAPNGKARKITCFADELNIPIGILPLPNGRDVIVGSIPNVWLLSDTDGSGKANKREILLTNFGYRDTHGMVNSFTLGLDGWVYACHGYSNQSTIKGKDGSSIQMHSGNTFRFRPDGTHIEHWSFGQVNPFGMTFDPFLNLYTADCETKPLTQIMRGAYNSSFGKPHGGLGFEPDMIGHNHNSSAICGPAWYDAEQFPPEYRGTMFLCNVVTNRINHDKIEFVGSTPKAILQPDFLISGDPWFRPVDIKLGPDGALYVSDFYNRIIGHYEVDLKHPGRDRNRGRIWRIVWRGSDGKISLPAMPGDWTKANCDVLMAGMKDTNLTNRLNAVREDRRRAVEKVPTCCEPIAHQGTLLEGVKLSSDLQVRLAEIYTQLESSRTNKLGKEELFPFALARVLSTDGDEEAALITTMFPKILKENSPKVQRAAIDALINHPNTACIANLLEFLPSIPPQDTHMRYAARLALRNCMQAVPDWVKWFAETKHSDADRDAIEDVALGVHNPAAAMFALSRLDHLRKGAPVPLPALIEHAAEYAPVDKTADILHFLQMAKGDIKEELGYFQSYQHGLQNRGAKLPPGAGSVAEKLVNHGLESKDPAVLQMSIDLAGSLKLSANFDALAALIQRGDATVSVRQTAISSLASLNAEKSIPILGKVLSDSTLPVPLRERAAQVLGGVNQPVAQEQLLTALQTAPAPLASIIGLAMVGTKEGAEKLFLGIEAGKASARLLSEQGILTKLRSSTLPKLDERIAAVTKGLPTAEQRITDLMRQRRDGYGKTKADADLGKAVFVKHCAVCHTIANEGAKIGPQLDGIGIRGLERLLEDILDPNRNVDLAFRASQILMKDGKSVTGLVQREEGKVLIVADLQGKEIRIPGEEIETRRVLLMSPMPANFDQAITEKDFYDLLAYLLRQKVK